MYGRFEALEVKILIKGNSPSLPRDLPQFLPLGNCVVKLLTYEHIISALSCVFIFVLVSFFHKTPLAIVYIALQILGLAFQITDECNEPKVSFGLISAISVFVANRHFGDSTRESRS